MTDTLIRTETFIAENTANCCEDCPDANVNPPDRSECPYFDYSADVPVCTREGNTQDAIKQWLGGEGILGALSLEHTVTINDVK